MKTTRTLTSTFTNVLGGSGTLMARALQGLRASLKGAACLVAIVIGISLCFIPETASNGSIKPYQSIKQLADYQLTEKQEACHNQITFKESSNNRYAVNGSHHGYYQGRSEYLKGQPDDVQFYWYYHYVAYRYGITEYDEPDYCKALHHLRVKGWQ